MKSAFKYVLETLGRKLDFKLYDTIHLKAMKHRSNLFNEIRDETSFVELEYDKRDNLFDLNKDNASDYLIFETPDKNGQYIARHQIKGINKIQSKFYAIINDCYKELESAKTMDEKLHIIARTHLHLEWLHVYKDGNARVNKLILLKLLAENGLDLCILDTPLEAEHTSLEKWKNKIIAGQERWKKSILEVDPEKQALFIEKQKKLIADPSLKDSDTSSSDEENFNEKEVEKEESQIFNRASEKLKNGEIDETIKDLENINLSEFDVDEFIFNTMLNFGKNNNNKDIITKLVKHFKDTRKINASKYTRGIYHLWTAKSIYELYLINKIENALKLCQKHLQLILANSDSKTYRDEAELFLKKIQQEKF